MNFKVTAYHGTGKEWSTKDGRGPFVPHRFEVEGWEGLVEWSRKPGSDAPTVGQTLEGDITASPNGDFPAKFKQAKTGGGFGGDAKSPEEKARIERMAHHKTAADLLRCAVDLGFVTREMVSDKNSLLNLHRQLADGLAADLPTGASL